MIYFHEGAYHELPEGADLPDGAVEVPRWPEPGETWDGSAFVFDGTALVAAAHAAIDAQAEAVRARFITNEPGQVGTYLQKEAEARAWLADNSATVPVLAGEAAALDMPLADLVAQVLAAATAWAVINGKIEGARRAAKMAASGATDAAGIRAATVIDWQDVIGD